MVSTTSSSRLSSRTAATTQVASVRCRPPRTSSPCSRRRSSSRSSSRCAPSPSTSRVRNSLSTEASNPVSVSSKPRTYFQSIRLRTASAAWRSDRPSANCSTDTKASRAGETAGRPRVANSPANWASSNSAPSASRIRIARHPLGNAARATCAVPAGTAWPERGHIVIVDRLWSLVHPLRTPDRSRSPSSAGRKFASGVLPGGKSKPANRACWAAAWSATRVVRSSASRPSSVRTCPTKASVS